MSHCHVRAFLPKITRESLFCICMLWFILRWSCSIQQICQKSNIWMWMWEGATAFVAVDNRRDQPAISKAVWRKKLSINQTAIDCFIHSDSLKKKMKYSWVFQTLGVRTKKTRHRWKNKKKKKQLSCTGSFGSLYLSAVFHNKSKMKNMKQIQLIRFGCPLLKLWQRLNGPEHSFILKTTQKVLLIVYLKEQPALIWSETTSHFIEPDFD